jgi:UDPglucose 6-dehydrogenase
MNELSQLAERIGVDIEHVRQGIGSDPRIGTQFLYPGAGYGGSCFPKDVKALVKTAADAGQRLQILSAVEAVNERQKHVLVDKIVQRFGPDLSGRRFALWGLSFKPGTDDMREAPSRVIIAGLTARGAQVIAYDPVAVDEAKRVMPDQGSLSYAPTADAALEGADALLIVTEWKEFRSPDFDGIRRSLKQPLVFDGRNLFEPELMKEVGVEYHGIGRAATR